MTRNGRRLWWLRLAVAGIAGGLVITGLPAVAAAAGGDSWTGLGDGKNWGNAANWSAGVPANGSSVLIAPTARESSPDVTGMPGGLQLASLSVTNSSLSGSAITVTGSFAWSVGPSRQNSINAPMTIAGPATISGAGEKASMAPMTFKGATSVSAGVLMTTDIGAAISNSGTFTIEPGATIQSIACCVALDKFVNTGTVKVPASTAGTATLHGMDLVNWGSISVGKGSLLHVTIGPVTLSPADTITGTGTVDFDQHAQVTLAGPVSIASGTTVQLDGGAALLGTGSFAGSGRFLWSGGTIAANLSVSKTVATVISGPDAKGIASPATKPVTLALAGITTFTGPAPVLMGAVAAVRNFGTLTMHATATFAGLSCCRAPDQVTNTGTVVIAAGTGAATFNAVAVLNRGTVKVASGRLVVNSLPFTQTAGVTTLAGGSLTAQYAVTIAAGKLTGHGTITGSVSNSGTVIPSTTTGILRITGSYTQGKMGMLSSSITGTTAGTKFGQLAVGGAATLTGTVSVRIATGFAPKKGASFLVLRYTSRSGAFAAKSGSLPYKVSYGANGVKIVF